MNPIFLSDSYKVTHWKQYPPKTEKVYSYFEARKGGEFKETVFFGLQYYLKTLSGELVTTYDIYEAKDLFEKHFGNKELFNEAGWRHILDIHNGRLPVSIKAVPEGTVVPEGNVLMTVENTDPACYWLTNFLETFLVQCWYGSTVATNSREIKRVILNFLEKNGDPKLIDFKLHDFGYRGVSSVESAGIGGAAHLLNFLGTDTLAAIDHINNTYYVKGDTPSWPFMGYSIPAAEHSTITSWGRDNELQAYNNMLEQYPDGLVAVVSDSYDIYNACESLWGGVLRDKVLRRNGTVVVRPDSGHPPTVVLKVLDILGSKFGYDINSKGFKVLDPHIRVIQGDGIDYDMIREILGNLHVHGWSADNIAFGMGGALLQKLNRDTLRFAFKCSSITIDGRDFDVSKSPATDDTKNSKPGRLKLVRGEDGLVTVRESSSGEDLLVEHFRDGEVLIDESFSTIRVRAKL